MKPILRVLFETHKKTFLQFAVEDLFAGIPKNVSDPGVSVLSEQKSKVEKWFMWMAYVLQRRMINSPHEAEMIHGMLLQVKMMAHIIGFAPATTEAAEGVSPAAKAQEDRRRREESLEDALKGARGFVKPPTP